MICACVLCWLADTIVCLNSPVSRTKRNQKKNAHTQRYTCMHLSSTPPVSSVNLSFLPQRNNQTPNSYSYLITDVWLNRRAHKVATEKQVIEQHYTLDWDKRKRKVNWWQRRNTVLPFDSPPSFSQSTKIHELYWSLFNTTPKNGFFALY